MCLQEALRRKDFYLVKEATTIFLKRIKESNSAELFFLPFYLLSPSGPVSHSKHLCPLKIEAPLLSRSPAGFQLHSLVILLQRGGQRNDNLNSKAPGLPWQSVQ